MSATIPLRPLYVKMSANLITFKLNNHTHGDNNTKIENPEQTLIFRHEGSYVLAMTQFEVTSQ